MPTFESVFETVDRQIQEIFARYEIYNQLFNNGDGNVDLLNASGSYVFHVFQRLLLDDILLALSRMTDPGGKNRQENASIKYLFALSRPYLSAEKTDAATTALARLDIQVSNIRVHRNKAIAHPDLAHAVGAETLPDIGYAEIEGAMQELTAIMLQLGNSNVRRVGGYKPIIAFGTDGNALLAKLRSAVSAGP